ncbi:Hypothetical predicted protein, partial [Mytilus galloprovincialis]
KCFRGPVVGKRDKTTVCSGCCNVDLCNIVDHCRGTTELIMFNYTRYCYSCSNGRQTSDDCNQITQCGLDKFCQIKQTFNIFNETRWIT